MKRCGKAKRTNTHGNPPRIRSSREEKARQLLESVASGAVSFVEKGSRKQQEDLNAVKKAVKVLGKKKADSILGCQTSDKDAMRRVLPLRFSSPRPRDKQNML